jgi:hypothetical protein
VRFLTSEAEDFREAELVSLGAPPEVDAELRFGEAGAKDVELVDVSVS